MSHCPGCRNYVVTAGEGTGAISGHGPCPGLPPEATIEELSGSVDGDLLPTAAELSGEPTREALVAGIREHIAALVPFVDTLLDLLSEPAYEIETEQVREAMVEAGLLFEEPHAQPCEIAGCGCDEEWAYLFKPGPALSKLRALLPPGGPATEG